MEGAEKEGGRGEKGGRRGRVARVLLCCASPGLVEEEGQEKTLLLPLSDSSLLEGNYSVINSLWSQDSLPLLLIAGE